MGPVRRALRQAVVPVSVVAVLIAAGVAVATRPSGSAPASITVMTRNLYLGGDIDRPVHAASAGGPQALLAVAAADAALRAVVDSTDYPGRSAALALEVARARPDLVGLQEVALWRSGPLKVPPPLGTSRDVGVPTAAHVDLDFLATLLDRLRALGEPYEAVSVQQESDVEAPAFADVGHLAEARDVRLTLRDVVLRRTGSPVRVERAASGSYATRLPVDVGGLRYTFVRGWNAVDVRVGTARLRFLNTHLESEQRTPTLAQAGELLAGPAAATDRPVVLVCDCNTDPLDTSVGRLPDGSPDAPKDAAYRLLTGRGRFTDAWPAVAPAAEGFTDGLSETLRDSPAEAAARFSRRIDFVLTRGVAAIESGAVVGRDPAERTAAGVWPSDHAGVVVRLRL